MTAQLQWFPERLTASINAAFKASIPEAKAAAEAAKPSAKVTISETVAGNSASLSSSPAFFEEGARPHEIAPKGGFLYLKGQNRFVSTPVEHPGSPAKPHLGPAAALWAKELFNRTASAVLAGAGFR
jgi:hypothetical protein